MIKRRFMAFVGSLCAAFVLEAASPFALADSGEPYVSPSGIIKVKSAFSVSETIARLKKDVSDKGIKFFIEVDQAKLAADAGIKLRPSTLLVFGNPPLGTLFITSNPNAGLDWPVRLLLTEDDNAREWGGWTSSAWRAARANTQGRPRAIRCVPQ